MTSGDVSLGVGLGNGDEDGDVVVGRFRLRTEKKDGYERLSILPFEAQERRGGE